jgi:hypothetical protein
MVGNITADNVVALNNMIIDNLVVVVSHVINFAIAATM